MAKSNLAVMPDSLPAVVAELESLGVELPTVTTTSLAAARALGEHTIGEQPLTAVLIADATAGTVDPKTIAERLTAAALERSAHDGALALAGDLHPRLLRAAIGAVHRDVDNIIGQLRRPFDAAAATVHDALSFIKPTDTADDVLRRGSAAQAAYLELIDAVPVLEKIRGLRISLSRPVSGPGDDGRVLAMFARDLAADLTGAAAAWSGRPGATLHIGGRWLAVAATGVRLHLNTEAEAEQVLAAAQAAEQQRSAQAAAQGPRLRGAVLL